MRYRIWPSSAIVLFILAASALVAMLPARGADQPEGQSPQLSSATVPVITVSMDQTDLDQVPLSSALPGETIEYTARIENATSEAQTNLRVIMAVTDNPSALTYVPDSTFIRRSYDQPYVPLGPPLSLRPISIAKVLEPQQMVFVKWRMQLSECASRDRWAQVAFRARTDESDPKLGLAYKNLYLYPHTSLPTHHFTASYHVEPQSPAPGEAVHHTVRVVNDGYMALDNVVVSVNGHETIDRYLPTIAEGSAYYVVSRRGGEGTPPVAIDPGWSKPGTGFNLVFLNPGQTLVLSWVDYVVPDTPVGTVVRPQVDIYPDQASEWTSAAARLTVSPPSDDLSVRIQNADPEYLIPLYLPGDRVTMRVTITNHTETVQEGLRAKIDLPFALSYVPGSAYLCTAPINGDGECDPLYAVPPYQDGNVRRLSDTWLNAPDPLSLVPGEKAAITFRARILDTAKPQEGIEARVVLSSANGGEELEAKIRLDIVRPAEIDVNVVDAPTTAERGDEIAYEVSITNAGQADLANVAFGIEETCDVRYVRGTLKVGGTTRDDSFLTKRFSTDQSGQRHDNVYHIGDLAAWRPNGPSNEVKISLTMQVADDVDAGNTAGPRFVITADRTSPAVAGTTNVSLRGMRKETEIEVVEPPATAEDVRTILARIEHVTGKTKANTQTIDKTLRRVKGLAEETRTKLLNEVDPWEQLAQGDIWWFIRWGGFGVLASFLAALVLPFTLWRVARWLGARYLGARMALGGREVALVMLFPPFWLVVVVPLRAVRSVWAFVRAHVHRRTRTQTGTGRSDEGGEQ